MLALLLCEYRSTRSPYSAWWCASLALFVPGASLYLQRHGPPGVGHPLANFFVVTRAACVWAGARSLWTASPPWWQVAIAPGVVAVFRRSTNRPATRAGGPFYLARCGCCSGWRRRAVPAAAGLLAGGHVGQRDLSARTAVDERGLRTGSRVFFGRWGSSSRWAGPTRCSDLVRRPGNDAGLDSAAATVSACRRSATSSRPRLCASPPPATVSPAAQPHRVLRLATEEVQETIRDGVECQLVPGRFSIISADQRRAGIIAGDHAIATFAERVHHRGAVRRLVGRDGGGAHHPAGGGQGRRATHVTDAIDDAMLQAAKRRSGSPGGEHVDRDRRGPLHLSAPSGRPAGLTGPRPPGGTQRALLPAVA